ncbi:transcription factor Adf-1-like [Camponotus floridanus]|uniref:transcription factor Adf-1-like n=1 Tax=Camponotus floridanus TaxID=104421 RepID=UPI000DC6C339|nr:transcription factor Adf-1-like [Camponotus floridanus]
MDHTFYFYDFQYQNDFNELNNEDDSQNEEENSYGVDQNGIAGDALLISLVRNYSYLYNKELTDFKDIIKKQNAWTEIGNILNMTAHECQSRWTRLRERYAREKKQKQEETTTGSGASKRKSFEFFENMQILERFVKRRRTIFNMYKNIPPSTKCIDLQKCLKY